MQNSLNRRGPWGHRQKHGVFLSLRDLALPTRSTVISLLELCHGVIQSILPDNIGIRLNAEARHLRYRNAAVFRAELCAIDRRLQIEPTPLDHGIGRADRSGHVNGGQQARAIVERVRHDRNIVDRRKRKDFLQ